MKGKITVTDDIRRRFPRAARISDNILTRKAVRGLSVEEICDAVGITKPTYCERIKNPTLWTVGDIIRLSKLMGVTVDELLNEQFGKTEREKNKNV